MRTLYAGLVIGSAALLACGGCPEGSPLQTLPEQDAGLVGNWTGTANGTMAITVVFGVEGSYSISGTGFINYGSYTTDGSKTPAWINVVNQRGQTWQGIYEITGTSLKWSENLGSRPASFTDAADAYVLTKIE